MNNIANKEWPLSCIATLVLVDNEILALFLINPTIDFSKASNTKRSLIFVILFLADKIAASLIRFFNWAPEKPPVNSAIILTLNLPSVFLFLI